MTLRELHEAATAGPWMVGFPDGSGADERALCVTGPHPLSHPVVVGGGEFDRQFGVVGDADAALIVAMRNALPALLDVAEAVGKFMAVECDESGSAFCPVDQLEAELEMNEAYTALRALEAD